MAVVLALITSVVYGTSDFFGGLASRRMPVATTMLWAHGVGLVAIASLAPSVSSHVVAGDFVIGALSGVIGLTGLLLLYRGLAIGPMSVVAPASAVTSAAVPLMIGLRDGTPSTAGSIGLGLGLVAVVATSWSDRTGERVRISTLVTSVAAGACFGALVLLYDMTDPDGAPWPIVWGRMTSVVCLAGWALFVTRRRFGDSQTDEPVGPAPGPPTSDSRRVPPVAAAFASRRIIGAILLAVGAGIGDTLANLTLLLATHAADDGVELATVSVLVALFPATTVVLARAVLREPLGPVRTAGLGIAAVAIGLLTLG